jgi:hypothetical protein
MNLILHYIGKRPYIAPTFISLYASSPAPKRRIWLTRIYTTNDRIVSTIINQTTSRRRRIISSIHLPPSFHPQNDFHLVSIPTQPTQCNKKRQRQPCRQNGYQTPYNAINHTRRFFVESSHQTRKQMRAAQTITQGFE